MIEIYFATNRSYKTRSSNDEKRKTSNVEFKNNLLSKPSFREFRVGKAIVLKKGNRYKIQNYKLYSESRVRSSKDIDKIMDNPEIVPEVKRQRSIQVAQELGKKRSQLGSLKVFREMQDEMKTNCVGGLFFIHGYASTFEESILRAAEIKDKYQGEGVKDMVTGVFCWPSNGDIYPPYEYYYDRSDAMMSGPVLARVLCKLRDFMRQIVKSGEECHHPIHLVAHSMGSYVLRNAVQSMVKNYARTGKYPIFENVFLMAPDEDEDAFERQGKLKPLTRMAKRINIYHSRNDQALIISDLTKGNPDRLGSGGPRNMGQISGRISAIDCSKVNSTGLVDGNHQYYRKRTEVVDDIVNVLAGLPEDEIPHRKAINNDYRRYRINPS